MPENPKQIPQRIALTRDSNRYYVWSAYPDWVQGVVVLSKPAAGASVHAAGSIVPLEASETQVYFDVIPAGQRGQNYNFTIDSAFHTLRVRETGAAGSELWILSTGLLVEADPITGTPI